MKKASSYIGVVAALAFGFNNAAFAYAEPLKGTIAEQQEFYKQHAIYQAAKMVLSFFPHDRAAAGAKVFAELELLNSPVAEGLDMNDLLNEGGCLPGGSGDGFLSGSCHAARLEKEAGEDENGIGLKEGPV